MPPTYIVCCVLRMAKGALSFRPLILPEVCDQIKQSGIAEVSPAVYTRYDHDGDTRKGVTDPVAQVWLHV